MPKRKIVVIGLLGPTLDAGKTSARWEKWRPTVALCQHAALPVERFELLEQKPFTGLADLVEKDIHQVAPETTVRRHLITMQNPWDLEEVYGALHDFARGYSFAPEKEDYLIHITTGTHIAQICLFLLTESRHLPGRLVQTSPQRGGGGPGSFTILDLDLSKYDRLASRFKKEQSEALSFLKSGIATRNALFNRTIERIEKVALHSPEPILLLGPTGAGKSQLARRIYELKRAKTLIAGEFVEVNCATLRGESAMATLFGHTKGAFTGAVEARAGLLRKAHRGTLFLDEIGELGSDEQAMLLRAIEEKRFYPVGSDKEHESDFQLIAGTNHELINDVASGRFRDDLLARINLWTFRLPSLCKRPEDIEPNLDFELDRAGTSLHLRVTFSKEARARFIDFATSPQALWRGNFRDFSAAVRRMATLAKGGRIGVSDVEEELARLHDTWRGPSATHREAGGLTFELLGERASQLDRFDRVQLEDVLSICRSARTLSEAGRQLFAVSLGQKQTRNDADRLRKYLARFDIDWKDVRQRAE